MKIENVGLKIGQAFILGHFKWSALILINDCINVLITF